MMEAINSLESKHDEFIKKYEENESKHDEFVKNWETS